MDKERINSMPSDDPLSPANRPQDAAHHPVELHKLNYASPNNSAPGSGRINSGLREAMGVVLLMFGGPLFLAGIGEWIHSLIGDWPAWSKRNEWIQAVVLPVLGLVMIIAGIRWMRGKKDNHVDRSGHE